MNWNDYFLGMAQYVSLKSKDTSTKVGAIIVDKKNRIVSLGFNGFPRGVDDNIVERYERPTKYKFTEHSERNAIFSARKDLEDCSIYIYPMPPCTDCARAIIQSGIKHVFYYDAVIPSHWQDDMNMSIIMFQEAGIEFKPIKFTESFTVTFK